MKLKKNIRVPLTKVGANNTRLLIMTEGYENIKKDEIFCTKCRCNAVEDEFDIMLLCPNENIAALRNRYSLSYRNNLTFGRFIMMMQGKNLNY